MKFSDIYNEIVALAIEDGKPIELLLCKTTEELGELAQSINKVIGIKTMKITDSNQTINENILEEVSDTIQCLISIIGKMGFTADDLKKELSKKNKKYKEIIISKQV